MQQILLIVQILLCVGLVTIVLLQQGRGADAGASFGGGSSGSLFGSRGPASFLSKVTAGLAALFFANSLALAYISGQSVERRSVVERVQTQPASGEAGLGTGGETCPSCLLSRPTERRARRTDPPCRGCRDPSDRLGSGVPGNDVPAEVVELVDTLS